jgi:hypothetical protein
MQDTKVIQWTNRALFEKVEKDMRSMHPVTHDNGNMVVFRTPVYEVTLVRQTMEEGIRTLA